MRDAGYLEVHWYTLDGEIPTREYISLEDVRSAINGQGNEVRTTEYVFPMESYANYTYLAELLNGSIETKFTLRYGMDKNPDIDPDAVEWGEAEYFFDGKKWSCTWRKIGEDGRLAKGKKIKCKYFQDSDNDKTRGKVLAAIRARDRRFRQNLAAYWRSQNIAVACVLTGEELLDALDAAHIHEVKDDGSDSWKRNGIFLRKDVHELFDRGLIRINPKDGCFELNPSLINTKSYAGLHGKKMHENIFCKIKENLAKRFDLFLSN